MTKLVLSLGFSLLALSSAQGADLVPLVEPTVVMDTSLVSSPLYIQLLGGATLGLDATFRNGGVLNVADPTQAGYALAGTIGINVVNGLSVEADVMRTFRNEVAAGQDTYGTMSLMGNVKYTVGVTDAFSIYGAVGAGYIWVDNFDGPPVNFQYNFGGVGYQLIAGAGYDFTDNLTGLAEVRYQDSFSDYDLMGNATLDLPTVTILGGLKLSF